MRTLLWRCAAQIGTFGALLLLGSPARAIEISAEIVPLGGDAYRAVYSVHNDGSLGAGVAVLLFDVFFDPADYLESSLSIVSPGSVSSEWDEQLLASAPGDPAAYDALALGAGIADGATAAGFAVEFEWIGDALLPGSQAFAIYDPDTFALLGSGVTIVPEPETLVLVAGGLAVVAATRRKRSGRDLA